MSDSSETNSSTKKKPEKTKQSVSANQELETVEQLIADGAKWSTYQYFVYHLQVVDTKASQLLTTQTVVLPLFGAILVGLVLSHRRFEKMLVLGMLFLLISIVLTLMATWTVWSSRLVTRSDISGILKLRNFKTHCLHAANILFLLGLLVCAISFCLQSFT